MDTGQGLFERSKASAFLRLVKADLGDVVAVRPWYAGGRKEEWFLGKVTLEHTATGWQGEAAVDAWIEQGSKKWFNVKARAAAAAHAARRAACRCFETCREGCAAWALGESSRAERQGGAVSRRPQTTHKGTAKPAKAVPAAGGQPSPATQPQPAQPQPQPAPAQTQPAQPQPQPAPAQPQKGPAQPQPQPAPAQPQPQPAPAQQQPPPAQPTSAAANQPQPGAGKPPAQPAPAAADPGPSSSNLGTTGGGLLGGLGEKMMTGLGLQRTAEKAPAPPSYVVR